MNILFSGLVSAVIAVAAEIYLRIFDLAFHDQGRSNLGLVSPNPLLDMQIGSLRTTNVK